MKICLLLKLSERSLKLCGFEFHIQWGKEAHSRHKFFKFFEIRRVLNAQTDSR